MRENPKPSLAPAIMPRSSIPLPPICFTVRAVASTDHPIRHDQGPDARKKGISTWPWSWDGTPASGLSGIASGRKEFQEHVALCSRRIDPVKPHAKIFGAGWKVFVAAYLLANPFWTNFQAQFVDRLMTLARQIFLYAPAFWVRPCRLNLADIAGLSTNCNGSCR